MRMSRISVFLWLVSISVTLICLALLLPRFSRSQSEVSISFNTAAGLEAGKTSVRYRNVEIGKIKELRLSKDRTRVLAIVQFTSPAKRFAMCGTRFWVVRPRIGITNVSGLATAISGSYVAADIRRNPNVCKSFIGLDNPPFDSGDQNGGRFVLQTKSIGSLNTGSPVYFRRVKVGQIISDSLNKAGTEVDIDVFVRAPYDSYVTSHARWWHASGIDLHLDATGLQLDTESIEAALHGGIAFDLPEPATEKRRVDDGTTFALKATRTEAMNAGDDSPPAPVRMTFNSSVRGLSIGAPVEFEGVELGQVTAVDLDFDPKELRSDVIVTLALFPYRLGRRYRAQLGHGSNKAARALLSQLVMQGLRGQLRTASILTGQRYVALDFFPHAPAVHINTEITPVDLPTVPNTLEELQDQLTDIVNRLDHVPFEEVGSNLNRALANANLLFKQADTELVPQAHTTLEAAQTSFNAASAMLQQNSPLQRDIQQALTALRVTLLSLRALSDFVEQQPESSFVWGKPAD